METEADQKTDETPNRQRQGHYAHRRDYRGAEPSDPSKNPPRQSKKGVEHAAKRTGEFGSDRTVK